MHEINFTAAKLH